MVISINQKLNIRKIPGYWVGIIISYLLVIGFASTKAYQYLESKTVDFRFMLRGNRSFSSELVLVLIDEPARQAIGNSRYPREMFAIMVYGLQAMGAQAIGLDFRFEEPRVPAADSLLVDVTSEVDNLVLGYYFRQLYEKSDLGYHDSLLSQFSKHALITEHAERLSCYHGENPVLPFPALFHSSHNLGHINVIIDEISGAVRALPLLVSYQDQCYPALSLALIKVFWQLSDRQIELQPGQIVLHPFGRAPVRIPASNKGDYLIDYQVDRAGIDNKFSFTDVLEQCRAILNDDSLAIQNAAFKDKIVLIGSLVDEDLFETPFSVDYAGVLIHANVINNILQGRFLRHENWRIKSSKVILMGMLLFAAFFLLQYPYKLIGSTTLILVYVYLIGRVFNSGGIIMTVIQPLLLIIIATAVMTAYDFYSEKRLNIVLSDKVNQQAHRLKDLEDKRYGFSPSTPYIKIMIPYIQLQNKGIFPHIIETSEDRVKDFPVFQKGLQVQNPLPIHIDKINKLLFDMGLLWNDYAAYILHDVKTEPKPIDRLRNIGRRIYRDFGLTGTFNNLFKSNCENLYLNFVLNDMRIPWHWAYDEKSNTFLCEKFPINISFASEKVGEFDSDRQTPPAKMKLSPEKAAILFYGDWKGHPGKELKAVGHEIEEIKTKFLENRLKTWTIHQEVEKFLDTIDQVIENHTDIRLIHYSGHAEEEYLDVGEHQYLPPGTIKQSRDLVFHSRPLVFLNACRSGQIKYVGEKYNNLATEFLACGAAACIVSFVDIFDATAKKFSLSFYQHFIEQGLTVGESIRLTRVTMAEVKYSEPYHPNYDITRYFYNLYGDPMLTF